MRTGSLVSLCRRRVEIAGFLTCHEWCASAAVSRGYIIRYCLVGLEGPQKLDEVQRGEKFQSLPGIQGLSGIRPPQLQHAVANCCLGGMGPRRPREWIFFEDHVLIELAPFLVSGSIS